ncbi:MAG: Dam family site-specific DNA-(adenine-N6)-methyltransferase [Raoultibacter sp.]
MKPFLNWPGGKRWLVAQYKEYLPTDSQCHIEPFLGSGAAFFHCTPSSAVLADANVQLIETYDAIREDWEQVYQYLKQHHDSHCADYYYATREQNCTTRFARAAQFIYLNRTCFNGIYRVNRKGRFNVPIGSKKKVIHDDDDFALWAAALNNAEIKAQDFRETIKDACEGDFIYADPPYTVQHNNNNFVKYNEQIFSWEDQVELCKVLTDANDRGVNVLISNADHDSIWNLYCSEIWQVDKVERFSGLAASNSRRKRITEVLISNKLMSD